MAGIVGTATLDSLTIGVVRGQLGRIHH